MHASIFIGGNGELLAEYIQKIPGRKIDYEVSKIGEVRALRDLVKFSYTEPVLIVIRDIDKASTEAQSALLKSIEEPSHGIAYAITATQEEKVLPSILSRGRVVYLARTETIEHKEYAANFFSSSVGGKLKITSKLRKREEAVEFLKKIVEGGHILMLKKPQFFVAIGEAENALEAIKSNGNVQLQLTNFIIQLETFDL